ncbi:phosphoribosylamine--glycine ligase [Arcanobacterium hippocoleae]|uniref:Phosphoribosylamine--glycine ligase n=1 Tax=Arcanobacterium hippocoleae TaxID=149017 RepID=A0ABU1T0L5_9ACTO|nr:phosphoribosylamine--glycine ligase [Arcanobacterium hippocoleae]MDR6938840.1 phosphoribosylamine--glycine ligase [Arcanobacterium hippocoleae]
MKIGVIGSGGREYAIIKTLHTQNPEAEIHAFPGNAAMSEFAVIHPQITAMDLAGVREFCLLEKIDLCIVTPDDPLMAGMVDELEAAGIACFGPRRAGALLEGSKSFAKAFMARHHIPTAAYESFTDFSAALEYVQNAQYPLVIKADGLALGKGVTIVENKAAAETTLREFMLEQKFGAASSQVVIEEFLTGPEISVLTFCDGKTIKPMLSAMDHKRVFDFDNGPNTGGMGVIAPNPWFTAEVAREFETKIMQPTLAGLRADACDFRGCLYFGLMLTDTGLKVIEYNARFGDPETQALLPLLESNLLEIFQAVSRQELRTAEVKFTDLHCACIVLAAAGYPENPEKGKEIDYAPEVAKNLIFAGVKRSAAGKLITNGGRVLNVLGTGKTLPEAISQAYQNVAKVEFANCHFRTDIGAKALGIEEEK